MTREPAAANPAERPVSVAEAGAGVPPTRRRVSGSGLVRVAWIAALLLPLVGLLSLLLRSKLDPSWENYRVHFVLFSTVGGGAYVLALVAGQSAERRGDARVLLISLA